MKSEIINNQFYRVKYLSIEKMIILMSKQSRFLCIGGFLNGTQVKDQGDSFVCVEKGKNVTYYKKDIFHPDAWDHDYYVCESTTDKHAYNWVYDIKK